MKKAIKLLGILVVSLIGINAVDAKVIDMTKDMTSSEIGAITEDTTINGNGHTITGTFSIKTSGIEFVLNNVNIDANASDGTTVIAIYINAVGTSLILNNVTISNYTKAGIYADQFANIVVDGSVFDGSRTVDIGDGSGSEATLIKRSAAGIDINIGESAEEDFAVEKIEIVNSEFRNVLASESNTTGGGIKVKIKDKTHLTSMADVIIKNNVFKDNVRDLVIGTDSPKKNTETTRLDTGDFNIKLFGNSEMKVVNNSSSATEEADRTEVIKSVNLGLKNYKIVDVLNKKINIPIKIKNDAKSAAIAESNFGSLKGYNRVLFLTLGTGIGGAVIINNKLLDTGDLPGCEIGHMVIEKDGLECNCGRKGCFEKYASMKAFKNNLRKTLGYDENFSGKELLALIKNTKKEDKNYNVINKIKQEYIEYLSIGLANLINIFEPEVIGIGGSFVYFEDVLLDDLKNEIISKDMLFNKRNEINIQTAVLGNEAGIIGAVL